MLNADLWVLYYPIHIINFLSLWMCSLEVVRLKDKQASALGSHLQWCVSGLQVAWEGCLSPAVAFSHGVPFGTRPSLPASACCSLEGADRCQCSKRRCFWYGPLTCAPSTWLLSLRWGGTLKGHVVQPLLEAG